MNLPWTVIGEDHSTDSGSAWLALPPAELDLDVTLGCGQAFRWRQAERPPEYCAEPHDDGSSDLAAQTCWTGIISNQVVSLWRSGEKLHCNMQPGPFDADLIDTYLDRRLNLEAVRREIAVDAHITTAMEGYPGLRVLQQEPWECLISFILSQWSNVGRISSTVEALAARFGAEILPGRFAFPTPLALAATSEETLRSMGLGYRAPYVLRTAKKCAEMGTEWLDGLARMEYRAARDHIVLPLNSKRQTEKIHGVGSKVADCVLLFSLGHYEAFPVDVHVRRAMERWYGDGNNLGKSYDLVADFGRRHFGRYAGYAQQYLFHRQRTGS